MAAVVMLASGVLSPLTTTRTPTDRLLANMFQSTLETSFKSNVCRYLPQIVKRFANLLGKTPMMMVARRLLNMSS